MSLPSNRAGVQPAARFADITIDGLEFSRQMGRVGGDIPVQALARLADVVVGDNGSLNCELSGSLDGDGKAWLELRVEGKLQLRCQRCLEAVPWTVGIDARLQLIAAGEAWPDDDLADDATDPIPAGTAMSVASLVEDEVLLAMPLAPKHENCALPGAAALGQEASPFAVLEQLKKH